MMKIAKLFLHKDWAKNTNFKRFKSSTIFSLSSGQGKCGVSVVRVSGHKSLETLKLLCGENFEPKPRYATLKNIYYPNTNEMIDQGLVLWFPGPKSFTGEDSCEFQVHGSLAVIDSLLLALSQIPGLRSAKPGEFTKRAFFSGKLDLIEVDGLADLIHAETEAQRKQALLQSTGCLSRLYTEWRKKLIRNIAHMEAYIDFAEDENIEDNILQDIEKDLTSLCSEIEKHLNDQRQGELLRTGIRTVIIGEPNVGKSSFLNLIMNRKVSIVTEIAGTTRDIIESAHNIGGYPIIFADTAGLRTKTQDSIEFEGMEMAKEYLKNADFVILLMDGSDLWKNYKNDLDSYKRIYLERLGLQEEVFERKSVMIVINKIDLLKETEVSNLIGLKECSLISCRNQKNINVVFDQMKEKLTNICGQPSPENPRLTQIRYRENLIKCHQHLQEFLLTDLKNIENLDLAITAEELKKPLRCIEIITGNVSTDEILDVVFKDFCIGK